MKSVRSHYSKNKIHCGKMVLCIMFFAIVGGLGMTLVSIKNRVYQMDLECVSMEKKIKEIQEQTREVEAHVATFSSRAWIDQKMQEGVLHLQPISDARIVHLNFDDPSPEMGKLQAVANRIGAQ